MKASVVLMLAALSCVPASLASTNIPAGPVSGLWTQAGSPYLIDGNISIAVDDALTIEPGCRIIFTGYYELRIFGRLVAAGTEGDSISFDASIPTTGWHGLRFIDTTTNGQDASLLTYCAFRNGRATGSAGEPQDGGAILCYRSANVRVSHCAFAHNYAADEGGALYLEAQSDVRVEDTQFLNNQAYFSGGAICCVGSSPVIVNSILDANTSTVFAGGIAGWYDAHFRLENVKVLDCVAGAVCGLYSVASDPVVVGCLFAGNTSTLGSGGGCGLTSGSNGRLINTTIAGNSSAQAGGGVWAYGSTVEITNCIVWSNLPNQIALISGSTANVSYSDISGGWAGIGNLNLVPEFVGSGPDPYALGELSPCIDAANPDTTGLGLPALDLSGHPRIVNGRVDMGGYEYVGAGGIAWPPVIAGVLAMRCAPNPCSPTTTVTYELPVPALVTLRICDIEGRQVRTLLDQVSQDAREHRVAWNGRGDAGELLPAGRYLYILTTGGERHMGAVTLIR